ncbi:hypothetical protein X798_00578 [Onchocerca flexuosa]|uniref:Uncharacterized protein n=1 Tax=Onchocerca flexuosa TaxID=387005 RepID=A0A238C3N9_9BILA|nr:hypothetical protein X798_00578 [Onchocerca flexuosa]
MILEAQNQPYKSIATTASSVQHENGFRNVDGPELQYLNRDKEMNGRRVLDLDSDSTTSSTSRRNTENIKADNDFIAWVERHSDLSSSASAAPVISTVTLPATDDTDSVKKRKAFSFFKRGLRNKESGGK